MSVQLRDLFPERPRLDLNLLNNFDDLQKKKIAIVGGAGSIGSEILINLLVASVTQVQIWDSDESRMHTLLLSLESTQRRSVGYRLVDIRNYESIESAFDEFKPQVVIHAAALKHVSILERQPHEAYLTNVVGTAHIVNAILRREYVEKALFVSSDKAANPINVLGKSKLIGEYLWSYGKETSSSKTKWSIVRFGNVFMSRGSVVETFISQIERGESVTITHSDMTRFFMDLSEAASLICLILNLSIDGISILKMGDPISIKLLAQRLFLHYGKCENIVYIGIKPGEKLTEELFSLSESQDVVDHGVFFNYKNKTSIATNKVLEPFPKSNGQSVQLLEEFASE